MRPNSPRLGRVIYSPSPALREREGPSAERWEGEGGRGRRTLTRPQADACGHPLPQCGRGVWRAPRPFISKIGAAQGAGEVVEDAVGQPRLLAGKEGVG